MSEGETPGWEHLGNRYAHAEDYRCTACGRERSISYYSDQFQKEGEPRPCGCGGDDSGE